MNFESHSQAGQDRWIWKMLEKKKDGFYIDIGCNPAVANSNTYALEQQGWKGLLVDIVPGCEHRKGTFTLSDAANPNDRLKLYYKYLPAVVDYLSLDCDNATLGAFLALPWNKVTFRCITLEHDVYRRGPADRNRMREILKEMNYHLVCADVLVKWPEKTLVPFEDWFAYPDLVNPERIEQFQCEHQFWVNILNRTLQPVEYEI